MDKEALIQVWDQFRQKYGVYLHLLEDFPEKKYHTHPVKGMRTPAQLVAHVSGTVVRDIAKGIAKGAITADESTEDAVAAGFKTKKEMLGFARECWEQANAAVAEIGPAAAFPGSPWCLPPPSGRPGW